MTAAPDDPQNEAVTPEPGATPSAVTVEAEVARISWPEGADVGEVQREVDRALRTHSRVETRVGVDDEAGQRTATWSGMRREGVMRRGDGGEDQIVYARLAADTPVHEPGGFRALLNSFLPRKRAIAQMLIRDPEGRVLLCGLTYKRDWDLPGGVVEVGESPRDAVVREVGEELSLDIEAGSLLLTDWLPPWGGWDDAVCLVYDGGVHPASVLAEVVKQTREIAEVAFCTVEQVRERATDFTARRVEAALAALDGGPGYAESGRA